MAEYDITAQIHQCLQEYSDAVKDDVDKAVDDCTRGLKKDLRVTSPKLTGGYASTWTHKTEKDYTRGGKKNTVYNSKNYQLTHLLERPHAGPYGKGTVGARPHIAAAEKKWNEEFAKRCEEACKK